MCEDVADEDILPPVLSFCKAPSLRPVVGIWDLFEDGILPFGGVRSSAPFFFVIEGMRETCESVFSALPGDRTSDGIFDISLLLPERERLLSIEHLEGELLNELEVKLRLLDVLFILLPVSSWVAIGELVLNLPRGRTMSLFSLLTLGDARFLVMSLRSR